MATLPPERRDILADLIIAIWGADDTNRERLVRELCGWEELAGVTSLAALVRAVATSLADATDDVPRDWAASLERWVPDLAPTVLQDALNFVAAFPDLVTLSSFADDPIGTTTALAAVAATGITRVASGTAPAVDALAQNLVALDVVDVASVVPDTLEVGLPSVPAEVVAALQNVVEAVFASDDGTTWEHALAGLADMSHADVLSALRVSEQLLLGAISGTGSDVSAEWSILPERVFELTPLARHLVGPEALVGYLGALVLDVPPEEEAERTYSQWFALGLAALTGTANHLATADVELAIRLSNEALSMCAAAT